MDDMNELEVHLIVEAALEEALQQLDRLSLSDEEVLRHLNGYPDFQDAWENFCDEGDL